MVGVDINNMGALNAPSRDLHPLRHGQKYEEDEEVGGMGGVGGVGGVGRKKINQDGHGKNDKFNPYKTNEINEINKNNGYDREEERDNHFPAIAEAPKEDIDGKEGHEEEEENRTNLYQQLDRNRNPKYLLWILAGSNLCIFLYLPIHLPISIQAYFCVSRASPVDTLNPPLNPSLPLHLPLYAGIVLCIACVTSAFSSFTFGDPTSLPLFTSLYLPIYPSHPLHLPLYSGIVLCIACVTSAFSSFTFGDPTNMHMHEGPGLAAASGSIFSCAVVCSTIWMASFR